jgi:hypothetical protein
MPQCTVKSDHFRLLLQNDLHPAIGLRAVPKITEKHIKPNNFQKMSVSLAVRVKIIRPTNCLLFAISDVFHM